MSQGVMERVMARFIEGEVCCEGMCGSGSGRGARIRRAEDRGIRGAQFGRPALSRLLPFDV